MTNAAARKEPASSVELGNAEYALSSRQLGYSAEIRRLQSEYKKSAGFAQKQLFVKMIHCFMRDLCGYPQGAYLVTTAAYGDETVGSHPHVVPVTYYANSTLFWFTISEDADDVHDLWVKQAQVYLDEPGKGNAARDCATNIVFSNFFLVDGAKRNIKNDAWSLWSASDVRGGRITRIDLRVLEKDEDLDPATSTVIEKRLRSLKYQTPPDVTKASRKGHEALAELMRKAGHDSMAYKAKAKRGEGPLDLPIYGIEQIEANERTRKAAALLQTESFDSKDGNPWRISRKVSYNSQLTLHRNLLICGDNVEVLQRLYDEHASFVDLIYIDPPFCSEETYNHRGLAFGTRFQDKWRNGLQSYLPWLSERLVLARQCLKDSGFFFIHLDWHAAHYLKVEMDKIFGMDNFRNEIVVRRTAKHTANQFEKLASLQVAQDIILMYSKTPGAKFSPPLRKASEKQKQGSWHALYNRADRPTMRYELLGQKIKQGQWMWGKERTYSAVRNYEEYEKKYRHLDFFDYWIEYAKETAKEYVRANPRSGKPEYWVSPKEYVPCNTDWMDLQAYAFSQGYKTEKSEILLERVLLASDPSALVMDFFCGSGTACQVAQKLGRRWIGVDQNPQAIEVTADRIRRTSARKDKAIGIDISDVTAVTSRGYSKFYASHYHREDVLTIDDTRKGSSLTEFQEFILDCYLPRDGRKGDVALHGFRTESGREVAVFVGPNGRETKQTDLVQFLESVERKAKTMSKVEVLGWSFSPTLLRILDHLVEAHGLSIELKKIHVSALRIEDVLRATNVKFLAAARAIVNIDRSGASLSCTLNLLSPVSEVRDIHWFIYPEASADLEKIEYNFIKDDEEVSEDETQDDFEGVSTDTADPKRHLKSLELKHTFKGIKDGEYRVYVRVTDRRGHPTAMIEDIKVEGKKVISHSASIESSVREAA